MLIMQLFHVATPKTPELPFSFRFRSNSRENLGDGPDDQGSWSSRPEYVASEVVQLIRNGTNGTMWVVENGKPAYEFIIPERRIE
ncbi:hypothetical protein NQ318_021822 [Aromia moschata]|uniref:Uncharacterized protein n=1 Tax=Aromia moschata TaxID=1265417 RepID=A0AAV8Z8Q9_9CUCU|nr:hypothetical protein NQ318_021822 [Aromia moschata]